MITKFLKEAFALLALDRWRASTVLLFPCIFFLLGLWPRSSVSATALFSLPATALAMPLMQLAFFLPWMAFPDGFRWPKGQASTFLGLEFQLTQPISRKTLFGTWAALYLVSFLIPLTTQCVISTQEPARHLKEPYRPEAREFYLSQFHGAYVTQNDEGLREIVLPRGGAAQAATDFAIGTSFLLITQGFVFQLWRRIWLAPILILLGVGMQVVLLRQMGDKIPLYEYLVVLIGQRPAIAFLAVALLGIGIEWACCRRFIRFEIIE